MLAPTTIDELCDTVRSLPRVQVRGGGTKSALSAAANVSLAGLSGILEYQPDEFTFTALSGTRVAEVRDALSDHGQYLPFDPPWPAAGATLGGTVAAGLSGSGRFRYGGVRDFLLGVKVVTADGQLVRGGGKVVKNAAGFDFPKLLVGSLGRLGVLVELTFKVFPAPAGTATLSADFPNAEAALSMMDRLAASSLELLSLDYEQPSRLWLRLGGLIAAVASRCERVRDFLGANVNVVIRADDKSLWHDAAEFAWVPPQHAIVKLPLVPRQIPDLENRLRPLAPPVVRRYCVGGNLAWLGWPVELNRQLLAEIAGSLGRPALVLTGEGAATALLGENNVFLTRLRSVFDPEGKFGADNGV